MNGKLVSKNFFWKLISCTEGENDEMDIPNSRERSRLKKRSKIFREEITIFMQNLNKKCQDHVLDSFNTFNAGSISDLRHVYKL